MHRLTVTLSTAFIILASANASAQSALASRPSVSLSAGRSFSICREQAWHQWRSSAATCP